MTLKHLSLALLLAAAPAYADTVTIVGQTVERGAIVSEGDLATGDIPAGEVRTALGAHDIIGKQATRRLEPGRIVRGNDVRVPFMVEKNSAVTLVVETGNLTITAAGRAMQGGKRGEVIRVQPLGNTTFIDGEIVAPARVRIAAGSTSVQTASR